MQKKLIHEKVQFEDTTSHLHLWFPQWIFLLPVSNLWNCSPQSVIIFCILLLLAWVNVVWDYYYYCRLWCISTTDSCMQQAGSGQTFRANSSEATCPQHPISFPSLLAELPISFTLNLVCQPCSTGGGPCPAMEDKWVQCSHLTNQNVIESSSIALPDLLLINATVHSGILCRHIQWRQYIHPHKHRHRLMLSYTRLCSCKLRDLTVPLSFYKDTRRTRGGTSGHPQILCILFFVM